MPREAASLGRSSSRPLPRRATSAQGWSTSAMVAVAAAAAATTALLITSSSRTRRRQKAASTTTRKKTALPTSSSHAAAAAAAAATTPHTTIQHGPAALATQQQQQPHILRFRPETHGKAAAAAAANSALDDEHKEQQDKNFARWAQAQPIPDETPGDVFDRQRCVPGWKQNRIENQHVLVLGVGGIGCSVALALCRLGVHRITLVDRDTVDASNLNRQILFARTDVGKRKVDAARNTLEDCHKFGTRIDTVHCDVVIEWKRIVQLASNCTAIFNNIDYGAVLDAAVNALSKRFAVPYVAGSTYSNNVEMTLYPGTAHAPCWACSENTNASFVIPKETLQRSVVATNMAMAMAAAKTNPPSLSDDNVVSQEEILKLLHCQLKMRGPIVKKIVQQSMQEEATCASGYCPVDRIAALMKRIQKHVLRELLPTYIDQMDDICFIPQDRPIPTRNLGSWICVCAGGSLMLVNLWVQHVMRGATVVVPLSDDRDGSELDRHHQYSQQQQQQKTTLAGEASIGSSSSLPDVHNWSQLVISLVQDGGLSYSGYHVAQEKDCPVCESMKHPETKLKR